MFGVHLELGDAPAFLVVPILGPDALSAWDELQLGQLAVVGLGDAALSGELTLDRCHVGETLLIDVEVAVVLFQVSCLVNLLSDLLVRLALQFGPVGRDHLDNQLVLWFEHVEHEALVAERTVGEVELLLNWRVGVEHAAHLEGLFGLLLHDGLAGGRCCHSLVYFGAGSELLLVVLVAGGGRELLELGLISRVDLRTNSADLGVLGADATGEASLRVEQVEDGAFVLLGVVLALGGSCALGRRSVGRLVAPVHLIVDPNKHLGLFGQDLLHLGVDRFFGDLLLALGHICVVLIHSDARLAQFGRISFPDVLADLEAEGCWARLVWAE